MSDYVTQEVASFLHQVSAVAPGFSYDFTHKWTLGGGRAANSTTGTGFCMAIWNAGLNSDPTVFLESYNKIIAECILSVIADKKNVTTV